MTEMAETEQPGVQTPEPEEQERALVAAVEALPIETGFTSADGFAMLQRAAKLLASSELVPTTFRGNVANCSIALEMSMRQNASPMAVMQNLYIVHGKPSWSSSFIIAAVNQTKKFSPLRFRMSGVEDRDDRICIAWATEKATGEVLESPPISIGMAKKEGWYSRNGSKWQTMPELMLRYRAATLFGRLYAPEVLMGMRTADEMIDITPEIEDATADRKAALAEKLAARKKQINGDAASLAEAEAQPVAEANRQSKTVAKGVVKHLEAIGKYAGLSGAQLEEIAGKKLADLTNPEWRNAVVVVIAHVAEQHQRSDDEVAAYVAQAFNKDHLANLTLAQMQSLVGWIKGELGV